MLTKVAQQMLVHSGESSPSPSLKQLLILHRSYHSKDDETYNLVFANNTKNMAQLSSEEHRRPPRNNADPMVNMYGRLKHVPGLN